MNEGVGVGSVNDHLGIFIPFMCFEKPPPPNLAWLKTIHVGRYISKTVHIRKKISNIITVEA
jgi:hypothetical protein